MNRDQKAAVIDRVAGEIESAGAVFAVDYRGLSVKQAVDLRNALREADAGFSVVKNTLTERAADQAGAEHLKPLLQGPTALTFVRGDAALAAKVIARFKRELGLLEWKGGQMDGQPLTPDELDSIARLPSREVLYGQFVGVIASPITGLVRGLASMIGGLASQLEQIREQGLVGQGAAPEEAPAEEAPAEEAPAEDAPAEEAPSQAEAPGDPVAEGEVAAETSETSDTPSEGEGTEEG
ncbi:MAG: large subunit ribosomal protein [Thermoleophilaceae bacterium]|nr:large subunit ribosomal protein [Thermoleophilaceae bacterium]